LSFVPIDALSHTLTLAPRVVVVSRAGVRCGGVRARVARERVRRRRAGGGPERAAEESAATF
jgi:hypothetical protein